VLHLEFLSFPSYLLYTGGAKCLDSVDKVIWVLPFLAVLDVSSTLYVESLGYSLELYEVGFLASFFVGAGLTYFYIIIYLLIIIGFAYVLWYIKNKELNPSRFFDKIVFLLLVGVACYIYMRLTAAFIGNFLLPYIVSGRTSWVLVAFLAYLSTAFALSIYLWQDVVTWVRASGNKKE